MVTLALHVLLLTLPAVNVPAAPQAEVLTCEPDADATLQTPVVQGFRAEPARGLTCTYSCSSGGTNYTLLCNKTTEEECCDIANTACPYIEPGSTGTASCSC